VSELKRDIEDVKWALRTFSVEERRRNAGMMRLSFGSGRCVNTVDSFERIVKRLELLEAKLGLLAR